MCSAAHGYRSCHCLCNLQASVSNRFCFLEDFLDNLIGLLMITPMLYHLIWPAGRPKVSQYTGLGTWNHVYTITITGTFGTSLPEAVYAQRLRVTLFACHELLRLHHVSTLLQSKLHVAGTRCRGLRSKPEPHAEANL